MRFDRHLLFSQAFRPFFPLAALASALSVVLWIASLTGGLPLSPNATLWHAHEMLFGFASAVIVGFVMTAVVNWTGLSPLTPQRLGWLVSLWLAARLFGLWPSATAQMLSAAADIWVLPLAGWYLGRVLIASNSRRNMMFIPLFGALALVNLAIHWGLHSGHIGLARDLLHTSAWLVGFLMVFMGGRVIPFFSSRRLSYNPQQYPALNWLSTLSALACALAIPLGHATLISVCAAVAGISTGLRVLLWQPWRTRVEPMLWILHLGYLWLAVAYLLQTGVQSGWLSWSTTAPLHALMAGGLGCLGLGMMSRVSLGHSGRPIATDAWITTSFVLIVAAGLLRMLAFAAPGGFWLLGMSALTWAIAFGLFAVRYIPWLWMQPEQPTR